MKPNYAKKNMRLANNTQFRPEQFKLYNYFKTYAPDVEVQLEYPIHVKYEGQNITRIPDLVDLTNYIAYFLNGEIHSAKKDNYDKLIIETYTQWKVEHINKDSDEWNWLWKH